MPPGPSRTDLARRAGLQPANEDNDAGVAHLGVERGDVAARRLVLGVGLEVGGMVDGDEVLRHGSLLSVQTGGLSAFIAWSNRRAGIRPEGGDEVADCRMILRVLSRH